MDKLKYSTGYRALLLLLLFSLYDVCSAAQCSQVSGFTLSPALTMVENSTEGVLSNDWETVSVRVDCSGLTKGKFVSHSFGIPGSFAGKSITFESLSYPLYATNVSDVFYFGHFVGSDSTPHPLGAKTFTVGGYPSFPGGTFQSYIPIKIRFYTPSKSMTPGIRSINSFELVKGLVQSSGFFSYSGNVTVQAFSFQVRGPSCTLVAPGEVQLKSVNLSALPAPGDTVDAGAFALAVKCGVNTPAYEVAYSMVDVNNPTNLTSTLALANQPGQASGVSVQVMDDATPVFFGAASKRTLGSMPKGSGFISKSMNARYIRTAATVRPGLVKTGVTVTLSYQ